MGEKVIVSSISNPAVTRVQVMCLMVYLHGGIWVRGEKPDMERVISSMDMGLKRHQLPSQCKQATD